jgi:hypothetical protein
MRTARGLLNFLLRAFGQRFRIFVPPTAQVEAIARSHGFLRRTYHRRGFWQVVVYTKRADGFPPRPPVSAPAGR